MGLARPVLLDIRKFEMLSVTLFSEQTEALMLHPIYLSNITPLLYKAINFPQISLLFLMFDQVWQS